MKSLLAHWCLKWGTLLVFAGCSSVEEGTAEVTVEREHPRQLYFAAEVEDYEHYEGTASENGCADDEDCLVSGSNNSTCAAEPVEILDDDFCQERWASSWPLPQLGRCGCVRSLCQWYFENDYDRACESDDDCDGLGPPPEGIHKAVWACVDQQCRFGVPDDRQ